MKNDRDRGFSLETFLFVLLVGLALVWFWPSVGEAGVGERGQEFVIHVINQSEQAQNVMVQPPAIQPQPVQQAAPAFTPGQLADCAYSQAAGLPAAGCPANAGELLGSGR